ncbi:MAG: hypothetical protein Q7S48_04645 [bacterium]|nr:hypothetical protein [bacterium]
MTIGELAVPPEARGVEDVSKDISAASENVATVETLVELMSSVNEISEMQAKLEEVVKALGKVSLSNDSRQNSHHASALLYKLGKKLEKIKANQDQSRMSSLIQDLKIFIDDDVINWLELDPAHL